MRVRCRACPRRQGNASDAQLEQSHAPEGPSPDQPGTLRAAGWGVAVRGLPWAGAADAGAAVAAEAGEARAAAGAPPGLASWQHAMTAAAGLPLTGFRQARQQQQQQLRGQGQGQGHRGHVYHCPAYRSQLRPQHSPPALLRLATATATARALQPAARGSAFGSRRPALPPCLPGSPHVRPGAWALRRQHSLQGEWGSIRAMRSPSPEWGTSGASGTAQQGGQLQGPP